MPCVHTAGLQDNDSVAGWMCLHALHAERELLAHLCARIWRRPLLHGTTSKHAAGGKGQAAGSSSIGKHSGRVSEAVTDKYPAC